MGAEGRDPNELVRFARLVKLMRSLQTNYFRGDRTPQAIAQAKDAERRVDKAVAWILVHRQGTLFPENRPRAGDGPGDRPAGPGTSR